MWLSPIETALAQDGRRNNTRCDLSTTVRRNRPMARVVRRTTSTSHTTTISTESSQRRRASTTTINIPRRILESAQLVFSKEEAPSVRSIVIGFTRRIEIVILVDGAWRGSEGVLHAVIRCPAAVRICACYTSTSKRLHLLHTSIHITTTTTSGTQRLMSTLLPPLDHPHHPPHTNGKTERAKCHTDTDNRVPARVVVVGRDAAACAT